MDDKTANKYKMVASLELGPVFSAGLLALLYGVIVLFSAICILMIVMAVEVPDSLPFTIFVWILYLGLMAVLIILLIKDRQKRSKLKLWAQDAVFLTALSNEAGSNNVNNVFVFFPFGLFLPMKYTKLLLTFDHNGRQVQRCSGRGAPEDLTMSRRNGYYRTFAKYAGREIPILYSPRYDQIIILKERRKR